MIFNPQVIDCNILWHSLCIYINARILDNIPFSFWDLGKHVLPTQNPFSSDFFPLLHWCKTCHFITVAFPTPPFCRFADSTSAMLSRFTYSIIQTLIRLILLFPDFKNNVKRNQDGLQYTFLKQHFYQSNGQEIRYYCVRESPPIVFWGCILE